jgi:hypothetical protein
MSKNATTKIPKLAEEDIFIRIWNFSIVWNALNSNLKQVLRQPSSHPPALHKIQL